MVPYIVFLLLVSTLRTSGYHPALLEAGNDMIVYDMDTSEPFCYPGVNPSSKNIFPLSSENTARNIGRVLCRNLGYTHLEREYGIPAGEVNGTKLLFYCQGYERLLEQCSADGGAENDCSKLLALKCGRCSKKLQVNMGDTLEITSPEYPNYTDAAVCEWQLRPPTMASFKLEFLNFRLPNTDSKGSCYVGFLEVTKEVNGELVEVMVRCGSAVPIPLTVQAEMLILRLSSGTFYPRPYISKRGFKVLVTVSSVPWSPGTLDTMESVSIALGVLLLLVILVIVLFVMRRRNWVRQRSKQRKRMQERLTSHRPNYHEALTAMIADIATNPLRHQSHHENGNMTATNSRRGGSLRETGRRGVGDPPRRFPCAARTTSVPLQQTNSSSLAPPIPSSAPPPFRRQHILPTIEAEGEPLSMDEQPIYMELDECNSNKSMFQSYVELKDIEQARNEFKIRVPSGSSVSGVPVSPRLPSPNTRHCSSQPHLFPGQPTSSPKSEKMFSSRLNVWPSSLSLSPSIKTLPSIGETPAEKSSVDGRNKCIQNSVSSRGSSPSSGVGNSSPYSSRTPIHSIHLSPIPRGRSTSGDVFYSSPVDSMECRRLPVVHVGESPLLTTEVLERQIRVTSYSSCDSVFTEDGSNITAQRRCACGSIHEKESATPEKGQQLSKSCGDVSRSPSVPKNQDGILEMIRSDPSLARGQTTTSLMAPVLRRVSQMFFGSSPFLSNTSETAKEPSTDAPEDEARPERNASGTRRLGKNTSRRAVSSSGILNPFRYNRLQNVCVSEREKASSCSDFKTTEDTQDATPTVPK